MTNQEWYRYLYDRAKNDPWYQECLRVCREREPELVKLRTSLTPQEQEILDLYIAACEELQFALIFLTR